MSESKERDQLRRIRIFSAVIAFVVVAAWIACGTAVVLSFHAHFGPVVAFTASVAIASIFITLVTYGVRQGLIR